MTDYMLPHVQLAPPEIAKHESTMRRGNRILKRWAAVHFGKKNKTRVFRESLFSGKIDAKALGMSDEDLMHINSVREIEKDIIFCFVKSAYRLAERASRANFTYLDKDDLMQEAIIIVRECVYTYSKKGTSFHTYMHWSIRRNLRRKINKANDLSGFSEEDMLLLTSFRRAQEQVGPSAPVEEVVGMMKDVGQDQIERLRDLTIRFVRSCEMSREDGDVDHYQNIGVCDDIAIEEDPRTNKLVKVVVEEMRKNITTDRKDKKSSIQNMFRSSGKKSQTKFQLVFRAMPDEVHEKFELAIQMANLSPFETDLIRAAHRGEHRFQAAIAEKHINPKTQAPYTRMTASNVLKSAMQTVLAIMESNAAVA